jgi:hypothetical protein
LYSLWSEAVVCKRDQKSGHHVRLGRSGLHTKFHSSPINVPRPASGEKTFPTRASRRFKSRDRLSGVKLILNCGIYVIEPYTKYVCVDERWGNRSCDMKAAFCRPGHHAPANFNVLIQLFQKKKYCPATLSSNLLKDFPLK